MITILDVRYFSNVVILLHIFLCRGRILVSELCYHWLKYHKYNASELMILQTFLIKLYCRTNVEIKGGLFMSVVGAFIVPHPPIIVEEVGKGEEQKLENTIKSYYEVAKRIDTLQPDTVIITTPHSIMYSDYFHISPGKTAIGSLEKFGAKKVSFEVNYDEELARSISINAKKMGLQAGTAGEKEASLDHGTTIPLYFMKPYLTKYQFVRIGLSGLPLLDHYRMGRCIAETADKLGRRVVFIASGDLSHRLLEEGPYGYASEGPQFDKEATQAIKDGDFLRFLEFTPEFCDSAAECGLRSFVIMSGALSGKAVKSELLSYEGPFGVGYAVASFDILGKDENRHFDNIYEQKQNIIVEERKLKEDDCVRLARLSLETYVKSGVVVSLSEDLPQELREEKAGVFVSLKMHGQLRGCIGTIDPVTSSVAEEIIRNAISAGLEDPRFAPVTNEELTKLVYSVDVLGKPEPIETIEELDVTRYGVIVSFGRKRGLLLPNLEGIDTPEQQVSIAMKKAGIAEKDNYTLERFEVVRHI